MKWYLCGPMSGYPDANYPTFIRATRILREHGINIVSPHETIPNQDGKIPWEVCLKHDLNTLTQCDGVIVLDGWTKSRGARLEVQTALALGMRILTFYADARLSTLDGGHAQSIVVQSKGPDMMLACPWNTGD